MESTAEKAGKLFWRSGLANTSLDAIAAETELFRTSLVAAYVDKRGLYLAALATYRASARRLMADAFGQPTLRTTLERFFENGLSVYLGGGDEALGCFMIGTAVTEAGDDAEIRAVLAEALREMDHALAARIRAAIDNGELGNDTDEDAVAEVLSATLYAMAIKARAGIPRGSLEKMARGAIDLLLTAKAPIRGR